MRKHYLALPFENTGNGSLPNVGHLTECVSEAEAVSRAEVMSSYPEYSGAVAVAMHRKDGVPVGNPVVKAAFGEFNADVVSIFKKLN